MEELRGNPGQLQVFESAGNCAVLAGPGSGKTRCLTLKLARMLAEDLRPPHAIACITYSNEWVRSLRRKLATLGVVEGPHVDIGTVHSFCLKFVVLPFAHLAGIPIPRPVAVVPKPERAAMLEQAAREVFGSRTPAGVAKTLERMRKMACTASEMDPRMAAVNARYEELIRAGGYLDFDDISSIAARLVEQHAWVRQVLAARFPILAIDEYQDLGVPLHRMVLALLESGAVRLLAVGDPDQSIYGFNGAQPHLLTALAKQEGVESVRLRFNYRSGRTILVAAEAALGETRLYTTKASGGPGTVDIHHCPEGITEQAALACKTIVPDALRRDPTRCPGDIAILYRNRYTGDVVASAADAAGLRYQRTDAGAPYEKTPLIRWLEDCAAWCADGWRTGEPSLSGLLHMFHGLSVVTRPNREQMRRQTLHLVGYLAEHRSAEVTLREWLRGLGSACLREFFALGSKHDEHEALRKLWKVTGPGQALDGMTTREFGGVRGSPDHLNLLTLHSAKGLEFQVVVILEPDHGAIPGWGADRPDQLAEERRKFYVGLTRAKNEVHLTHSGFTVGAYGRRFRNGPSPFLEEVRRRLAEAA